ncbi:efflux RND transporter periplasmic adaptor subunit [Flavobacterium sp. AG291]|uniref:efflux RND transporter periplasmic adaptor subunit n=1 Tax=Flavobacterium sp. AG291 TaxID=2184000 RepID=UPI000E0BE798|nr:efflux RND transporter periplasmic adaptor subunit [Flavobacterium sp. AG291]RDI09782.1 membrane fusion protein (multidrug efflux system) [Flavobacterium sp. AG291]
MKRIIIIVAIVLVAGLAFYGFSGSGEGQAPAPQAVSVPVLTIGQGQAVTYQEYPVTVEGRVNVEIRPQVDGYLDKVFVDEGAFVKAGQPIFKINENRYRELLNNAQGSLNAAEGALMNAKLEVEKMTPLVEGKVVSEYQLKNAKASVKIAEANKKQAEAAVASAKINLGYTLITAPVNGYITRLPKKQGSLVSAADPTPLTLLSDIDEVYAYFSIGEADFIAFKEKYEGNTLNDKLKKLPPVTLVMADNSEYEQKGKIDMVDGQFDRTTGAITLRASFPNAKGLLRSGNTGRVKLGISHANAIVVPQAATAEIQDKVFVYIVDKDNKVTRTPITISGKTGTDYLIKDGLKAGDRIVYKGFETLADGTVVVPEKVQEEVVSK